ncbi:hypothetical protein ACFX16_032865 [Malus domestica]
MQMFWLASPQRWKTRKKKGRTQCTRLTLYARSGRGECRLALPPFMERLLPSLEPETYRSWAKALAIAPSDKVQAKQIRYKATRYLIINDQLYKRGFNLPYLRCLTPAKTETVIREIHERVCGDHAGSRSLTHKAFRQGYYWPTFHQDAIRISRSCDKCQCYVTIPYSPSESHTSMISP